MKKHLLAFVPAGTILSLLPSCQSGPDGHIASPSGKLTAEVFLTAEGQPAYTIRFDNQLLIDTSGLGFSFLNAPELKQAMRISSRSSRSFDETWEMPWGEQRLVRNRYNELRTRFTETAEPHRYVDVVFRLYDDGLGFRYEYPEQPGPDTLYITAELTRYRLTGDHRVWWTPGDWDIYEHLYNDTPFSRIDATSKRNHPNLAQTYIPYNAVNTPVTMKTEEGIYLSFHEAALIDYAGITLAVDTANLEMHTQLVGSWRDYLVARAPGFVTPWRSIHIAEKATDLIQSMLIVNLNEPSVLDDVSWIRPLKYMGIWWEMHLGKSSWDMASGRHGATTENALKYIDFAAENQIDAVLIEGWNTGWENWIGTAEREGIFDFVTPYPDYDLKKVNRYARERNVALIMHHETSSAVTTYEQQLDTAYSLMSHLGIHAVKTGYVGTIIPRGEYHHGQWMVNHYMRVLQTAARHKVAVNSHEPIMATGLRRTWPNDMTREGLRGQEFNAWASDGGNPPNHLPTVAFTRMLAGPIDYTPGIFHISLDPYKPDNQVNTTLAQQLALYVVIYSPMQMAADLPVYYENQPAFQFIRDVAVDWEQTRVIDGEVGEFVAIARQQRGSDDWFFGAITNEQARSLRLPADFLDPSKTYLATIYADDPQSHYRDNPTAYLIEMREADRESVLELWMAPGGGVAISFHAL